MKIINKNILLLAMIALPAICFAQPFESCKVNYAGKAPTIKDFARAYCSQCEAGSFEREALAAFSEGSHQSRVSGGCNDCFVDTQNGYVSFTSFKYGTGGTIENQESFEMRYWDCDNKNEKLVAVNYIYTSLGFDDSYLTFYRYNAKTKTMNLIEAPFDRIPDVPDLIDQDKAPKDVVDYVLTSQNEDANKFQPFFKLSYNNTGITCRMADPNAIPKEYQRERKLIWDGSIFIFK